MSEKIIDQQIERAEKERMPEKVNLFVRHPSVKWLEFLLQKAEDEGKDVETYVPVDKEGLKTTRLLIQYLKDNLSKRISAEQLHQGFSVITSTLKRAKSEAGIISKNLKLAHTENTEIPVPLNNKPKQSELFAEMFWIDNKHEALELKKEAEAKGVPAIDLWFEKQGDNVIKRLNQEIPRIQEGQEYLKQTDTPVNIIFTHRLTLTLHLWMIEEQNKGRTEFRITKEDLPHIRELNDKIAHTSISEIDYFKGNQAEIKSIGETPHLNKDV